MKRFTQCICTILVLTIMLAMPAAAATVEQRASDYFMRFSVFIDEVSSSKFDVWFDVTAVDTMDKLGVKEIKVQRSTDEENWTTMKTYKMENYSQMTDTNTFWHAGSVSYNYSSGYSYRAVIVLYAKLGSSYGQYTVTTPIFEA